MQSKGFIKLLAVLFALASIWQLSFTFVAKYQENRKAPAVAEQKLAEAQADSAMAVELEDPARREQFLEDAKTKYLNEIKNTNIYLGYTYKEVKNKELNLGLDLKGGMSVTLEIQLEDLVKAVADPDSVATEAFQNAIKTASEKSRNSNKSFIELFSEAYTGDLAAAFPDKEGNIVEALSNDANAAISSAFNVLSNRIDGFGVAQPNIQRVGNTGRILVELPGVKEPERVRTLLQGTASLEFWKCYICSDELGTSLNSLYADQELMAKYDNKIPALLSAGQEATIARVSSSEDRKMLNEFFNDPKVKDIMPADFHVIWSAKPSKYTYKGNNNVEFYELYAIKGTRAELEGDVVTDARVQYASQSKNKPEVSMNMNAKGADIWAKVTREAAPLHRQIAVVLDGLVYSCPRVNSEISGGSSQITGDFTFEEAEDLANILKSGKLPAPAQIVQSEVVGPSLGANSIQAGLISFLIAFVLVLLYMIFFYRRAGIVADIALLCNVLLLFGFLVSFGAILTLPGIAGLVLTMGMAVDANVIIFERIKEELAGGKALSKAIEDGFSNAYSAIIDGQITTLLTGIVLFVAGSGPVRGFATTLIFGIISSVLTAIFIPRLIFLRRVEKGKNITFESKVTKNFLKNTNIDFIGKRKYAYILSGVVIIGCLVSIFTKGFTMGIDFTGGSTYVVKFDDSVNTEEIRGLVNAKFSEAGENSSAIVKQFGADNQVKITTSYKNGDDQASKEIEEILYTALKDVYKTDITLDDFRNTQDEELGIVSSESVGPTIANEIKNKAIIAVVIALIVIFAYIAVRFRKWTWGLGGVASLAHTALIVIGFFSIFSGILPFTLDVDMTFIAAVLTIIGYAINDNVVIFDRIREYKKEHPKADFKQNVNLALNATLSRTMNTSLTTLITMLAIAIFGGEVIRGLAVALIVGIVVGTYASLFIGTTVMYDATRAVEKKGKNE